ncbi:response regulator transcription factor [Actinomadura nitritigenes]|jgi:DNA-binding response OmpR family regulator|uniref:response regulator transcription factor n=1 Tax=Actinomadura TaxID=1988 RepID=UPI001689E529|nr:response regulator transcription factor [Actinomadura sp. RB99]MBD2894379.1 Transcriptional regulatory protein KdpE [Actinomadura sp. RB99]
MARILVVDDDPRLVKVVSTLLRKHHHRVEAVPTGELARQALRRGNVDITLLDVNLPDVNGLSLILEMRQEGNDVPVILLTVRTEVHDQTLGLRLGGDDYITKPFNPEVLLARIEAVLRRAQGTGVVQRDDEVDDNLVEIPPIVIDFAARQVFKDGEVVRLAPLEYSILEFLAANRGRAVSKEELMLDVWGTSRGVSRTLAEHISRLRRKLGDGLIVTQTGYGYLVPGAR